MGLDMYLTAKKYFSGWEHSTDSERVAFAAVLAAAGLSQSVSAQDSPSLTVSVTVVYWRKANAIHKWFVDTVQDGKDECQPAHVSRDQLTELVRLCNEVIETKNPALLPPANGFFFGSTDVDEGYWDDIKQTAEEIQALLLNPSLATSGFEYQSSW